MNHIADFATDILAPIQARASYRQGMAEKLAGIIAELLNKHEPLLKATATGDEVTVAERGGSLAFSLTVFPDPIPPRDEDVANNASSTDK